MNGLEQKMLNIFKGVHEFMTISKLTNINLETVIIFAIVYFFFKSMKHGVSKHDKELSISF